MDSEKRLLVDAKDLTHRPPLDDAKMSIIFEMCKKEVKKSVIYDQELVN